jgi:hypothetical protein
MRACTSFHSLLSSPKIRNPTVPKHATKYILEPTQRPMSRSSSTTHAPPCARPGIPYPYRPHGPSLPGRVRIPTRTVRTQPLRVPC